MNIILMLDLVLSVKKNKQTKKTINFLKLIAIRTSSVPALNIFNIVKLEKLIACIKVLILTAVVVLLYDLHYIMV